jgi:hypothetical protein
VCDGELWLAGDLECSTCKAGTYSSTGGMHNVSCGCAPRDKAVGTTWMLRDKLLLEKEWGRRRGEGME